MRGRTPADSNENDYRKRHEVEQAAKLKAMLDLVEVRDNPGRSRAPRKIGVMTCNTGIKTGYHNVNVDFVLRLDHDGTFIAEHGNTWYLSKSRDALKAKMDQVAKVTLELRWTRYLLIDYETLYHDGRWGGTGHLRVGHKRDKKHEVIGMSLSWEVVEYSNAIELPGQGPRYMKREVDDGMPSDSQTTERELPDGLVPYSKEREELLRRLRAALVDVDAKMVELFSGAPGRVATRFDELAAGKYPTVLALPERVPKKR